MSDNVQEIEKLNCKQKIQTYRTNFIIYIYSLVKNKMINVKYCPTTEQLADVLTKLLDYVKFKELKAHIVN